MKTGAGDGYDDDGARMQMGVPSWSVRRGKLGEVIVTFRGTISAESGEASVNAFLKELDSGPVDLIFDARGCTGYESAARAAWQRVLFPRRGEIRSIAVASDSAVIRLGATMMAMALGISSHTVDDIDTR